MTAGQVNKLIEYVSKDVYYYEYIKRNSINEGHTFNHLELLVNKKRKLVEVMFRGVLVGDISIMETSTILEAYKCAKFFELFGEKLQ